MIRELSLEKINPLLSNNILNIHKALEEHSLIEHLSPFYAGGYPMSLLFAPRIRHRPLEINSLYYSDYDVYFSSTEKAEEAIDILSKYVVMPPYITENATTLAIRSKSNSTEPKIFQIVNKIIAAPKDILRTFDFINCAVGFSPKESTFQLHQDAPTLHRDRLLEILNPWMLHEALASNNEEEVKSNVIVQLIRFKKYSIRWNYMLSNDSFDLLIKAYEKYPRLYVSANTPIRVTGGAYAGCEWIAYKNQNVWDAMKGLITCHPKMKNYKDKHGFFDNRVAKDPSESWQIENNGNSLQPIDNNPTVLPF